MMRFLPAVALALLASPAAADDASDFFTLFERTCAKSLATPARFVEAAKAAGASFSFAISKRPEAEAEASWNDATYWTLDGDPRGLTLSMAVAGSAAVHRLSCIVYGAPHAPITVEAAVAHIRAAMGLGEPTSIHPNATDGDNESGANWSLGSGQDLRRIGVSIPSANSDALASIVVITQEHVR